MPTSANNPEERRYCAARVVAANARDAADLAELLDMLGLTAAEGRLLTEPADPAPIPAPRQHSEADRDLATTLLAAVTHAL